MTLDLNTIATTIAGYFGPSLTPPAGMGAIRAAYTEPQNAVTVTPAVDLRLDASEWFTGNGTRIGRQEWNLRFIYDAVPADARRSEIALRKWFGTLSYGLLNHVQAGGLVDSCRMMKQTVGTFAFDKDYYGIECIIETTTTEPWAASS